MKRFLLVFLLGAALLVLPAAPAFAATFYVSPSGGDDTYNIQHAFDRAVAAGPGSTVRLGPGNFYTNTIVVENFRGYFKGAGMGETFIDTLRGLDPNMDGVSLTDLEPFAFLIGFKGGNVSVSAMSFDITAHDPAEPFYSSGRTDLGEVVVVTGNASSSFDQVSFTSGEGDEVVGSNVVGDIGIVGKAQADQDGNWLSLAPTGGVHRVTRCSFAGLSGIEVVGLRAGSVIVGGSAAMRNVFNNYWEGIFLVDVSNSCVAVSHNRITTVGGGWGVFGWQGWVAGSGGALPPLPAPRYIITDNDISASGDGAAGVFLLDLSYDSGAASRLKAVIASNTIVLDDAWRGISEYCTKNIRVLHNCLSGSAAAGIYVGDDFGGPDGTTLWPIRGWKIIGNDLRDLTASEAPIVLGEGTSRCVVVCPWMTDVLDKGAHNILVNANRLPWP